MRVFVVGGAGFLGTHLVIRLAGHEHDSTVLTRSSEKTPRLLSIDIKAVVVELLAPESFLPKLIPQDIVISVAVPHISS